jgi:hypothetical protein
MAVTIAAASRYFLIFSSSNQVRGECRSVTLCSGERGQLPVPYVPGTTSQEPCFPLEWPHETR